MVTRSYFSLGHTSTLLVRHPLYSSHFLSLSCHMSSLSWSHVLSIVSLPLSLLVTHPLYWSHFLFLGHTSSLLATLPLSWSHVLPLGNMSTLLVSLPFPLAICPLSLSFLLYFTSSLPQPFSTQAI